MTWSLASPQKVIREGEEERTRELPKWKQRHVLYPNLRSELPSRVLCSVGHSPDTVWEGMTQGSEDQVPGIMGALVELVH